ncbi:hypothetical protein FQZ97_1067660 [compost metagenome]
MVRSSIEVMLLDALALHQHEEALHALLGDFTTGLEETDVRRQVISLGILHVIDQRHWPERPQDEQGARIPLRTPVEALAPIES